MQLTRKYERKVLMNLKIEYCVPYGLNLDSNILDRTIESMPKRVEAI